MLKNFEHVSIDNIPRFFPFPFQVSSFGYMTKSHREKLKTRIYKKNIEICIRISSVDPYAYDEIGGIVYRTAFPHVIVKLPDIPQRYSIEHPRRTVHFVYDAKRFEELTGGIFTKPPYVWQFQMNPLIMRLIGSMRNMTRRAHEPFVADQVDITAFALLEAVFAQNKAIVESIRGKKNFEMSSYIQTNYNTELTIGNISEKFGVSSRTFLRNWKRNNQGTPHSHLSELRLNEAKRLLEETTLQIADIAERVGFNDYSYFIQCFRKKYGETPLRYRKKCGRKEPDKNNPGAAQNNG